MTWIVLAFPVVLMLVLLSLERLEAVLLDPQRPPPEATGAAGAPAAAEHDLPVRTAAAPSGDRLPHLSRPAPRAPSRPAYHP